MLARDPHDLHVLLSAYACAPNRGSEPGLGWNTMVALSQQCRLTVVTQGRNRPVIEAWLAENPLPNVTFRYVYLPRWVFRLRPKKACAYLLYSVWQWRMLETAREVLASDPYDLVHHLTFASLHMPMFSHHLPVPLIYGPAGGGEMAPMRFWGGGGKRGLLHETLRWARMHTLRFDPLVRSMYGGTARLLTTTPESAAIVPARFRPRARVLPSVAVHPPKHLQRIPAENATFRVYTAGRLLHWKRVDLAIRAFARLLQTHPNASFDIVGYGPQWQRLQALTQRLGVDAQVNFWGWQEHDTVLQLLAEADVFLAPSLHDSGGMAVLEAMAAGVPPIVLATGGPAIMVDDSSGVRVPLTTPRQVVHDLTAALAELAREPDRREALARGARRRASELFTWDQHAERLLEVYWQTLYPATPLHPVVPAPRRAVASTAPDVSSTAADGAAVVRPTLSAPVRINAAAPRRRRVNE